MSQSQTTVDRTKRSSSLLVRKVKNSHLVFVSLEGACTTFTDTKTLLEVVKKRRRCSQTQQCRALPVVASRTLADCAESSPAQGDVTRN